MSELSLVRRGGGGAHVATGVLTSLNATHKLSVSGLGFQPTKVMMTMVRTDVYSVAWQNFIIGVYTGTGSNFQVAVTNSGGNFLGMNGTMTFTPNSDGFTLETLETTQYEFRASEAFNLWWMATDED